ncbi:putative bifunctional diguanylate cyclase/phosphodiesterase [Faunimonas sp. B44]|uniref:putative bifunctional diguanylate cyclase/phosphodiesterase n=1 Tax=Faunimonas sp. B44 TaxID=3461493 RepID=UPI0040449289
MASEKERLRYLDRLQIVDTERTPGFDRMVDLACRVFDLPMATVSLVGADRQWFKASRGMCMTGTDRRVAFCDATIRSDEVFVVPDAAADPRFADNPQVTGEPFLRFYAGAPLIVGPDVRIGSLCVMDREPRQFSARDCSLLELLAAQTVELIRQHQAGLRLERNLRQRRRQLHLLLEQNRLLEDQERQLRQISRLARIGGWSVDLATGDASWTPEALAILGCTGEAPATFADGFRQQPARDRAALLDAFRATASSGRPFILESGLDGDVDESRWVRVIGERDARDRVIGTVQDVTRECEMKAELERLATRDGLTGLANRRVFRDTLTRAAAEASQENPAALLLVDLDNFKDVNDTLGHHAGDQLLRDMAARLTGCLGDDALIARPGGDEFAVFLQGDETVSLPEIADRVLATATAPIQYNGQTLRVGASVGIAVARGPKPSDELLRRADIAVYEAKHAGGDRWAVYSPELGARVEHRHRLFQEVREAIDQHHFTVAYQPVVCLRSGEAVAQEVLIRWCHPTDGLRSAGEFIDALEDPAIGRLLSNRAIQLAVPQFADWRRTGVPVHGIGVNIAAGQLRDSAFPDTLIHLIEKHGLSPADIRLEITEGVLLGRGADVAMRKVSEMHAAGFRIILDDFGTGYASLTHLRELPVDGVKIDTSFVRSMTREPADRIIVRSVIEMAHGLGMTVVAEGVETPEMDALLKIMGCDFGQGFYYGRPVLAPQIEAAAAFRRAG